MQRKKRDRWLNVRVSEDELATLRRLATESRISFSGYVRARLLDRPRAHKRAMMLAESIPELRQLRVELLREGNNYNQIAYELNRRKDRISESEYRTITERLKDVEAMRKSALSKVAKLLARIA